MVRSLPQKGSWNVNKCMQHYLKSFTAFLQLVLQVFVWRGTYLSLLHHAVKTGYFPVLVNTKRDGVLQFQVWSHTQARGHCWKFNCSYTLQKGALYNLQVITLKTELITVIIKNMPLPMQYLSFLAHALTKCSLQNYRVYCNKL